MTPQFARTIGQVQGAGTPNGTPGPLLYGLVRQTQPDTIVEIGAWQGHSTLWMAQACKENQCGRVYAYDNWSLTGGSPDALREAASCAGVHPQIVLVDGDSLERAWPPVVDFCFIDGNHNRAYPEAEFLRAVAAGAKTIVLHDTTSWWGPRDLLEALRATHSQAWDVLELSVADGVTVFQRRQPKSAVSFAEVNYPEGFIR